MEPVDAFVVAPEPAGAAQVRVDDDGGDVGAGDRMRVALDADVPEAVGSVPGFEDVAGATGGDDSVALMTRVPSAVSARSSASSAVRVP